MSEHGLFAELDIKSISEEGVIEGYAAYYRNVDGGGDIIVPGAFRESLSRRAANKVKMLMHHDVRRPVGIWQSLTEDGNGLKASGRILLQTQEGREAFEFLKAGALDGLSVGFRTVEADFDRKTGVRTISKADLYEVSLVTMPMNERARIMAVKSADEVTRRDLEAILRDAGYSGAEAKTIASRFKDQQPRDVAEVDLTEVASVLKARVDIFKQN